MAYELSTFSKTISKSKASLRNDFSSQDRRYDVPVDTGDCRPDKELWQGGTIGHYLTVRVSAPELLFGTSDGALRALNANTGKPVPGFGNEGTVSMREGVADHYRKRGYGLSSPPVIHKNLVINGLHVQETPSLGPYGDVRAWDVHSGKPTWTFHTIPRPGEPGNETWQGRSWRERSGANVWGTMTVDVDHGMVSCQSTKPPQLSKGRSKGSESL